MKIREGLITIAAIFVIFFVFLLVKELKESGKNEVKIEQLEAVTNNQKATNEVKIKQQKIISLPVPNDDYIDKWMQWLTEENAYSLE